MTLHPDTFCCYCGELLAEFGITEEAEVCWGRDGAPYCSPDCRAEAEDGHHAGIVDTLGDYARADYYPY